MFTKTKKQSNSFHPTLSVGQFFKYASKSFRETNIEKCLKSSYFPNNTMLVNSGTSAFALVIEELNLVGKTIVMPAYLCETLLPVLIHYNIKPLFIDIEEDTYQPPLSAYSEDVINRADAILLVATYGKRPRAEVFNHLISQGKIIIEDFAMRSPFLKEPLLGDARIYSLPKTLPTPDGGLAVIKNGNKEKRIGKHSLSLKYIKNALKLLPMMAFFISNVRDKIDRKKDTPKWAGIGEASNMTKRIFADECKSQHENKEFLKYPYCEPFKQENPKDSVNKLRKHKISAERIWINPIIKNPDAHSIFGVDYKDFPITCSVSKKIVCAPLWHIQDEDSYNKYKSELEEILS